MAATNNKVVIPNLPLNTQGGQWRLMWSLTRAIKKAGWKYKASGNGTTKDQGTDDPALDKWGPGTATGISGSTAAIGTPARGRANVTGLSGMSSGDKGRFIAFTTSGTPANNHQHQIEEIVSSTEVVIDARTFAVAADAGPLTWSVLDPVLDSWTTYGYALDNPTAWWCAEGPAVLKIPITAAPTVGTSDFIRGENITQTTTGFQGELLSYVWDGSSSGYLVVTPRVRGTGAGRYGLSSGADTITGDWSGTTAVGASVGVALEYREQIVIWKGSGTPNEWYGSIFLGYFDVVNDNAERYSTLAAAVGCSSTVAPGGGGTGNSFPTHGYVVRGNGTSGSHVDWMGLSSYLTVGKGFVIAFDAIEEAAHSADGTFTGGLANLNGSSSPAVETEWLSYHRLNDTEDGELYPFVWIGNMYNNSQLHTVASRTFALSASYMGFSSMGCSAWATPDYIHSMRGWRRRGLSNESYDEFEQAVLVINVGSTIYTLMKLHAMYPETAHCVPIPSRVREPIWAVSIPRTASPPTSYAKCRKGTLRWAFWTQGGQRYNMSESGAWIQFGCGYNNYSTWSSSLPTIIHGGWDNTVQSAQ